MSIMKKSAYEKPSISIVELTSCRGLCTISDTGEGWDVIKPGEPNVPAGARNHNGNLWDEELWDDE